MKLDNNIIKFIEDVVQTAKLVDIDNIVIEPERVRGMDENRSVVLFHEDEDLNLGIGSIGLTRIDTLLSRLEMVKTQDEFEVVATIDKEREFVRSMTIKAKGTKVEYRCADPTHINAPRQINDTMMATVQLTPEAVLLLHKAVTAMGNAEFVTIKCNGDEVTFELEDINGDVFDHTFAKGVDHNFSYKYPVKTLLALFKQNSNGVFEVGQKGIVRVTHNNLGVLVLPSV